MHSFLFSGKCCSVLDASQALWVFDIGDKSDAELTKVTTNLPFLKHAATLECRTCRASFANEAMCSAWTSFGGSLSDGDVVTWKTGKSSKSWKSKFAPLGSM